MTEETDDFFTLLSCCVQQVRGAIERQYGLVPFNDAPTYGRLLTLVTACALDERLLPKLTAAVAERARMMGLTK